MNLKEKVIFSLIIPLVVSMSAATGIYYLLNGNDINASNIANNEKNTVQISNKIVEEESQLIDVIEKASPAVVSIVVSKDLPQFYTNPFFYFYGIPQPESSQEGAKKQVGGGTGFIVSEEGLVLTNRHVVSDVNAEFSIIMSDGNTFMGTVVSMDPANDLAVMQIYLNEDGKKKPSNLPTLTLGDSDSLKIGSKVIAIGNALSEFNNTTTTGIISGKGRSITAGGAGQRATALNNLLQTDAAINPGNSGGPLLNLAGEVIGINTAIAQQANGIGFAIPINDVTSAIESVQEHGRIVRPFLGVRYTQLTPSIAKELALFVEYGAYIVDDVENRIPAVIKNSPADKAGLRSGDIIVAVNDNEIDKNHTLVHLISKFKVNDTVQLTVVRGRNKIILPVKLEEFKE